MTCSTTVKLKLKLFHISPLGALLRCCDMSIKNSTVGAVCDENSQIVMATAGTADSGSTAPTGISLLNLPHVLP